MVENDRTNQNFADNSTNSFGIRETIEKSISNLQKLKGQTNTKQHLVKSGMSSIAQNATLCEPRHNSKLTLSLNSVISRENKSLTDYEKAVIELMFLYGLRISEVLNITFADVSELGGIRISGLKGSNDRLVYAFVYREFWINLKKNRVCIPSSLNRFYFYRLFKKIGIYSIIGKHSNKSVTHILRYNFINTLIKDNSDINTIQQLLGHKSINSTIHYVENLKK